jgi:hypothetical protein
MNEAFSTLSGSLSMAKGAWSNLVTGLADDSADLDMLIGNFVESVGAVAENLIPTIGKALNGAVKLVKDIIPVIISEIPPLITDNLPILAEAAIGLIQGLADGLMENKDVLVKTILDVAVYLVENVLGLLPQVLELGIQLVLTLANGLSEAIPSLLPTVVDVIIKIIETLLSPESLTNILSAALTLVVELSKGLIDVVPKLIDAVFILVDNLVDFLISPDSIGMLIGAAVELVIALTVGLIKATPKLLVGLGSLIIGIAETIIKFDWASLGKNIVAGFKNGIANEWKNLKTWFKNLFGDLIGIAKKILGIASPSKVFKKLGSFTADGFGIGFEDEFAKVKDDMEDALNFDDASVGINTSIRKVGAGASGGAFGGTSIGTVNITVNGGNYPDEQSLASAIALEIQNMTDRRAAVYA